MVKKTKRQKQSKKAGASAKKAKNKTEKQLIKLAHEGSEKSLKKISEIAAKTKDGGLIKFAGFAYDEGEFLRYAPKNEREEKELLLAKMIKDKEDYVDTLMMKADSAKLEIKKLDLDREVYEKILAKNKEYEYWFSEDYYMTVKNKLAELEEDMSYESLWIAEARKSIKTEKYKNIPVDFFYHFHFDGEGGSFWEDGSDNLDELDELDELDGLGDSNNF